MTCLFLATKSESERISIEDFGKKLRLPSTVSVLNLEFTVSQGLKFQYYVHHPFRPAYGFFLDMQQTIDVKILKVIYKQAVNQTIPDILLQDLPLIYQPSQLALAALVHASRENGYEEHVTGYIHKKFGEKDAGHLLNMMERILEFLTSDKAVTHEEAKKIDYRLRIVMNPESALYVSIIRSKDYCSLTLL